MAPGLTLQHTTLPLHLISRLFFANVLYVYYIQTLLCLSTEVAVDNPE